MPELDYEGMDYPTLLKRFVDDIQFDCHSDWISFGRSKAADELYRKGKEALRPILDYIKETGVDTSLRLKGDEFELVWVRLFDRIEKRVDPEKTGPEDLRNMPGWIEWAEAFA